MVLAETGAVVPDWENEQVVGINKELPRCTAMPYPDFGAAVRGRRMDSPWCRVLNGQWKFHWAATPEQRSVDFYKAEYDVQAWGQIAVPGNWQVQGHGVPLYVNTRYPFGKNLRGQTRMALPFVR